MIDEIGKMEVFSNSFQTSINQILNNLNSKNILLVATVPNKPLAFSDKIKSNQLSKVITVRCYLCFTNISKSHLTNCTKVTFQNRNKIFDEIYESIVESVKI